MKNGGGGKWWDYTFNPWVGCEKVSEGCEHCYAERETNRFFTAKNDETQITGQSPFHGLWKPGAERRVFSNGYWQKPLAWNRKAEKSGQMRIILCGTWCDVCDPKGPKEQIINLWEIVQITPWLFWVFVTKRPELLNCLVPFQFFVLHNVMLMTSVENSQHIDRVSIMMDCPALYYGISVEPLIERINFLPTRYFLKHYRMNELCIPYCPSERYVDYVIVGGETGPKCRPMTVNWAREIYYNFCNPVNGKKIPFFMKQLGGFPNKRDRMEDFPDDLRIRQFPAVLQPDGTLMQRCIDTTFSTTEISL